MGTYSAAQRPKNPDLTLDPSDLELRFSGPRISDHR